MSQDLSDFSYHTPITPELFAEQMAVKEKLYDFNALRPSDHESQAALLNDLLGSHNGAHIVAPFYCDMGKNIHFKLGGFLNAGVKILDMAPVTFGERVLIGPNVVISTASHPLTLAERVLPVAPANPIAIGDNVWIGAGAVILDGVTIGDRAVIGAGSVVTKDIPADVLAVGNPCKVIRTIEQPPLPSDEALDEMWRPVIEMFGEM
ncbi:sugar O-acetyltransferase [Photobacterium aphoticum]|uniref:Acetyltransferase n=1 Tax=Photobacterium aphoticum TaxID=754436 RepID=A0A0J1GN60_9GAMM|nr:sugar O-acetyltransferase [Photobacterium aphoticum]KLV00894.1 acetyltransferase [Photobacterium aphoticum]PSU58937.1 sugar O-acetyltransferase [Photobacterium aphoticum]GHA57801.1 acetyltransferase [Photobacterium aphoticum]